MVKKKPSKETLTIEESLAERFGKNVIVDAQYVIDSPRIIVPISPMIDGMLGGGIPFGSFVISTGPPKIGKTSLSLNMAGSALSIPTEFDMPRMVYVFNIEGRVNPRDLMGIKTLAPYFKQKKVKIIQSELGNIKTAEDYLDMGEQLINEMPGSIFIFDSFSQLCSKEGMDKSWDGKGYRDNVPKYLSHFCKRISNVIPINKSIVVGITHQIANTGFGFSSWAEASGNKIQYAVDVKLKASHCTPWKDGETNIGQDIHWECLCSPLHNGPTETKCISKFRYGYGIDKEAELVNIAVDLGVIKKGGAWYTFPDETKYQGLEKCRDALEEDQELYDSINKQYREMMDLK